MIFDPKTAYNDLPYLPSKIDLKDQELLLATIKASEAIAQLKTILTENKRSINNSIDLLSILFVPEAVSSSAIENIVTTNKRVYSAKTKDEHQLIYSEKQALDYVKALVEGLRRASDKGFLATNDYIAVQQELIPDRKGIRKLPVHIADPVTQTVYYTPPDAEKQIRDLLYNFEKYFNEVAPTHEVFARMAILHYQFEAIHPFTDGNGRTGRILMPLYLTLQQKLPVPVLFISHYILEHRDEYYKRIRAVTFKGEWKEWILFITEATAVQAEYTCEILDDIRLTFNRVKRIIKYTLPTIYSYELVDFLFSNTNFTQKEFEKKLRVSPMTARKYLKLLQSKNIVTKKRQPGKNKFIYTNPSYIKILGKV